MLETTTLEKSIKYALPIAQKLYDKIAKPLIENKVLNLIDRRIELGNFKNNSISYLASLYGQSSIINTIAFQNAPKKLSDLYIPLTITELSSGAEIVINEENGSLEHHDRILLTDNAGMGKSTLCKKIILNEISNGNTIPIFVELRRLTNANISQYISKQLKIESHHLDYVISRAPFTFLFDGVDEIEPELTKDIIDSINRFISNNQENRFIITSRKETYLSNFTNFKYFNIKRLKESESYELIKKYDPTGIIAQKLITSLRQNKNNSINEFLVTPLYVSLLFCSYRHKTVIPQKKNLFYSQVFEALFDSHDLSKDIGYVRKKHSGLDSTEFHSLLRRLAFWCLKNGGKLEFTKDEIEIVTKEILTQCQDLNCAASSFIKDITSTVPLFVKEGSYIRWSHKSLMEYFSAMFIAHDVRSKSNEILNKMLESTSWLRYQNIFDLYADIDFSGFKEYLGEKCVEKYLDELKRAKDLLTDCEIPEKTIEERSALCFGRTITINTKKKNSDELFALIEDDDKKDEVNKKSFFVLNRAKNTIVIMISEDSDSMIYKILSSRMKSLTPKESSQRENVNADFLNCPENEYLVNNEPKCPLNSTENFPKVNELLSLISKIETISENDAITLLSSITENKTRGVYALLDGF